MKTPNLIFEFERSTRFSPKFADANQDLFLNLISIKPMHIGLSDPPGSMRSFSTLS